MRVVETAGLADPNLTPIYRWMLQQPISKQRPQQWPALMKSIVERRGFGSVLAHLIPKSVDQTHQMFGFIKIWMLMEVDQHFRKLYGQCLPEVVYGEPSRLHTDLQQIFAATKQAMLSDLREHLILFAWDPLPSKRKYVS